jgi:nucleoside-diphosphate-sugar epimerase
MNNTKLKKGLGLIPSISLKEGISDLIINNS